jgi:hypothetical protein
MNKEDIYDRYNLVVRPTFTDGMSRVLDMGGTLQMYARSNNADYDELRNDMENVGEDLIEVYEQFKEKTSK